MRISYVRLLHACFFTGRFHRAAPSRSSFSRWGLAMPDCDMARLLFPPSDGRTDQVSTFPPRRPWPCPPPGIDATEGIFQAGLEDKRFREGHSGAESGESSLLYDQSECRNVFLQPRVHRRFRLLARNDGVKFPGGAQEGHGRLTAVRPKSCREVLPAAPFPESRPSSFMRRRIMVTPVLNFGLPGSR